MKNTTAVYNNDVIHLNDSIIKNVTYKSEENELQENIKNLVIAHCFTYNLNSNDIMLEYCYNTSIRREIPSNIAENCVLKCVIFLQNSTDNCIVVTNIDYKKYLYKQFYEAENHVYICKQQIGTHILTSPCNYLYTTIDEPIETLDIYIYSTKQNVTSNINIKENDKLQIECKHIYAGNNINYEYYNDILYYNKFKHKFIDNIISNTFYNNTFYKVIKGSDSENINIINELENITKPNRFSNKLIYQDVLSESTCEWIIQIFKKNAKEISKYAFNKKENPQLHDLILFATVRFVFPFVMKSFGFSDIDELNINIDDKFSIMHVRDNNLLNMNNKPTNRQFTIDILLSNKNSSIDKYFTFNDKTIYNIKQGDAIVYYSKHKQCNSTYEPSFYLINVTFDITTKKTQRLDVF